MKRVVVCSLFAALVAPIATAHADVSEADRRFDQGKALLDQGDVRAACDAFEASNRLEPGVGTTLHLGSCREKLGDLRAAYDTFADAREMAASRGDDRVAVAEKYMRAIDARLGKIRVVVDADADVEGLAVEVDGIAVDEGARRDVIRVAPGRHLVRATAPGKRPFVASVEAHGERIDVRVVWPSEGSEKPATPPAQAHDADDPGFSWTGMHTAATVVGAAGVAAVVGGAVSGAMAFSSWSDAEKYCSSGEGTRTCSRPGIDLASSATTESTLSTALFVAGGAAVATSVVFFVVATASDDQAEDVAIAPIVAPGVYGVAVGGRFR